MKHGEVGGVLLVLQVGIELVKRASGTECLVHQRTSRERANVGAGSATLEGLAGEKQAALQRIGVAVEGLGGRHQRLSNDGQGSRCQFAKHFTRNRNIAPAQPLETPRRDACFETLRVTLGGLFVVCGRNNIPTASGCSGRNEMPD